MSINWTFFPRNKKAPDKLIETIAVFEKHEKDIDSANHQYHSDEVLAILAEDFEALGYKVEKSKKKEDKIRVPVLFGENGKEEIAFEADAYHPAWEIVMEVEAGRALVNYQFLKDFYESCMMEGVKYSIIAVRNKYKTSNDYKRICDFINNMYLSERVSIPLTGILILGY